MEKIRVDEMQIYLQMYNSRAISRATFLEKVGLDMKMEQKREDEEVEKYSQNLVCSSENKKVLKFKKLHEDAIIPKYQTGGASGFDFHALIEGNSDLTKKILIDPKDQVLIRTGLSCSIPNGYEIQIRPKSGLSLKHKLIITNTPGTVDSDYSPPNEIKIIIYNLGDSPYVVQNGQRIAQGVFCPVIQANIVEIEEISDEDVNRNRGGGFGSTGIK